MTVGGIGVELGGTTVTVGAGVDVGGTAVAVGAGVAVGVVGADVQPTVSVATTSSAPSVNAMAMSPVPRFGVTSHVTTKS